MDSRYKDRETLKSYFQRGDVPTEEQFAELIDSVHNIQDDGWAAVAGKDGLRLRPEGDGGVFASVCSGSPSSPETAPLWRFALGEDGSLEIRNEADEPVWILGRDKCVTVPESLKAGKYLLAGTGGEETPDTGDFLKIRADGYWHDLPVEAAVSMEAAGYRVYRLSACYLNRLSKSHSECEATASHSEGRKCRVCSPRKHWWGWSGHIKIRWQRKNGKLHLQMKCRNVQKGSETIFCRIETLWNL